MDSPKQYSPIEVNWDYEVAANRRHRFLSPSLRTFVAFQKPIILKRGHMQYVWDEKGKQYLDCLAQNLCISVGHSHPFVTAEATKQAQELTHCTTMYYHPVPAHFAEELVAKMPAGEEWVAHFVRQATAVTRGNRSRSHRVTLPAPPSR